MIGYRLQLIGSSHTPGNDNDVYPYLEYYLDFAYMRLAKYIWPYSDDGIHVRYSALFCRIL